MQQSLMKRTAIVSVVFFVISFITIIYLSAEKVVTVVDVAQDEVQKQTTVKTETIQESENNNLTFLLGEADTSFLRIPLPKECRADDIIIENHYMDQELWIFIPTAEEKFYADNAISGNREMVKQGSYEFAQDGCRLKFQLTDVYECRTILENQNLYINFLFPREIYDKIVVIDPAYGGIYTGNTNGELVEKEVTLRIAQKLKEKLDGSDVKAYYTRMDNENPSEESRVFLANKTKADMYIRIELNAADDSSIYGTETVYNGDYFIPGFGSVELADCLEREVVTSIKGKALGLVEATENDYTIRQATVPAATVKVGYLSNKQEANLLSRDEYVDKIATGIYNAIMQIYGEE